MLFRDFFQNTAKEVDKELELFFQGWKKDVEGISSRLYPFSDALADACRGGKRIRGALVKLGYEMVKGEGRRAMGVNEILKIAAAYEIFQAAILAHDDIIDESPLRRGEPSLFTRLGGGHNGESLALCLGDIGFFLAFQLISESGFPAKEKNRALSIFSKTMLETGIGELLDVELGIGAKRESMPASVRELAEIIEDIIKVYKYKTAYYTISAPLLLGGVLGGLKDRSLSAIKIFGQNLGIAFQIQDDINDIFSNEKQFGKEVGGDIKEGKQTILYVYAKGHASAVQSDLLKKYYGNFEIGAREIEAVKEIMIETGALDYTRKEAKRYSQAAKESIPEITKSKKYREMLGEMAEYFIDKKI